jgi:hypothetical protein
MSGALVVYGAEDDQGRALFVTSALYHCADLLRGKRVKYIGVRSLVVEVAAEVLAFDTGLHVDIGDTNPESDPDKAFHDAALYAAVVFQDAGGLGLSYILRRGIPNIIAVQFPREAEFTAERAARLSAAHDPAIYANLLRGALGGNW